MTTHRRARGFTLIELMLVLAISAIVVGALGHLMTRRRAELHLEHRRALQPLVAEAVVRALRVDLRSATKVAVEGGALTIRHRDGRKTSYRLSQGWLERHVEGGERRARQASPGERLGAFASFEPRARGRLLLLRLTQRRVAGPLSAWHRLETQLAIGGP